MQELCKVVTDVGIGSATVTLDRDGMLSLTIWQPDTAVVCHRLSPTDAYALADALIESAGAFVRAVGCGEVEQLAQAVFDESQATMTLAEIADETFNRR